MSLREAIESYPGRLTDSDRRLVQILLANPAECAFLSVSELAKRADVHSATAIRLAQKLGFDGYPELRELLQDDIICVVDPAERRRRRLAQVKIGAVLEDLVAYEITALGQLSSQVPQKKIDQAARFIRNARQVFIFGLGNSHALVELYAGHLRRIGFLVTTLGNQDRDTAEKLNSMTREDVILAFAVRQIPRGLVPLLNSAKKMGARSVLISDHIGLLVRPNPDCLLAATRGGREDESQSLLVPMAIGDALVLTISGLDESAALKALERCNAMVKSLDRPEKEKDTNYGNDRG